MNRWLKRAGYTLGALVTLVLVAVGSIYGLSARRFGKTYSVAPEQIAVSTDSATLARGKHIAAAVAGCTNCHGEDLRGTVMIDQAPMGRLVALNLTKGEGGVGGALTPESVERAIRHGVGRDGKPLRVMPSKEFQYLSEDDTRALVSYVLNLPPTDNVLAPTKLMLLPRALMVANLMPMLSAEVIEKSAGKPMAVPLGVTKEYGEYLATVGGCTNCHGPGLSGGKMEGGDPSWGPAANLTPEGNLGKWSEAEFFQTMRTGKRPDGIELKEPMPWKSIGRMTDEELRAVWMYLQSVPRKPFGGR